MKLLTGILVLIFIGGAIYQFGIMKPVSVSISDLDDPCGAVAIVNVEQALILTRPSRFSRTLSTLGSGSKVSLCDKIGDWYGIIVQKAGVNCIHSENNVIYTRKCLSGWILKSDVDFFAG